MNQYKYDICICSTVKDAAMTKVIYDSIVNYRLPKKISLPNPNLGYNQIFIDTTESEYDEKVDAILRSSRYLMILCSTAAGASKAISERLVHFKEISGGENVIAVMVEGEPPACFPPEFIETKYVRRLMPDMSIREYTETVEPVASDLKGASPKEFKEKLRYETVRIVASVLEIHPDVLEKRHEKRRKRAIRAVVISLSVILLAIAGIFTWFGLKAKREGDIFTKQTIISSQVAERLTEELPEKFSDIPEAQAAIQQAIENAEAEIYGGR